MPAGVPSSFIPLSSIPTRDVYSEHLESALMALFAAGPGHHPFLLGLLQLPPSPPLPPDTHSIPHSRPQDFPPHGASRDMADLPLPAQFPHPPIPSGSSHLLSVHRTHTRLTPTLGPLPQLFLLRVRRFLLGAAGSNLSFRPPNPSPVNVPSRAEVLRHASSFLSSLPCVTGSFVSSITPGFRTW